MSTTGAHGQLLLPNPCVSNGSRPPAKLQVSHAANQCSWLEIHRRPDGLIRYSLGAPTFGELALTFNALYDTFPGIQLGRPTACPISSIYHTHGCFLRAVAGVRSHFWPIRLALEADRAGLLLRSLSSPALRRQELVLQVLFRPTGWWERSFWSTTYANFVDNQTGRLRDELDARFAEPSYHVEIRAAVLGSSTRSAYRALDPWLSSWLSVQGARWWSFRLVNARHREAFYRELRGHAMDRFVGKKSRRDVSGTELAHVLPIPWKEHHPEISYAGAPTGRVPADLLASPPGRPHLIVGHVGIDRVRLPDHWNHLAILGRTRSGKSTLAQNLVLQILEKRPDAKVVIIEPTGNLIRGLVDRLPARVAADTIEIDPAHPTFERDGAEMATVPLNLLHLPGRQFLGPAEFERKAERLSGDLLQAIKNAWGAGSIGGRAEFILRAVLQGLVSVERTNLVDAYAALSDKEVLRRLERLASGGPLKSALKVHLPKLDYSITISSLDKVGKIATNPVLRKALCQRYGTVSFEELLDRQLLLLNLGKDALGTEGANFLGAIFLTQLWSALQARGRTDVPVYLVVDEFHNYAIPVFADMLSEGARLGLHVLAITQYLNRIPEQVRSALVGNVDAWGFFPVGAEDMKEAYSIAQGAPFGWFPEHLVSGLGPHQMALATRGSLLKVATFAARPEAADTGALRQAAEKSSRRHARPEDSEASPLAVSQEQVKVFLGATDVDSKRSRFDLAERLRWPRQQVDAAVALCKATGDILDGFDQETTLSPRGLYHRRAIEAARNEGVDHIELLTDICAVLNAKGLYPRIVEQGGGYLVPDAEFEWAGRTYNVEVECSTLGSGEGQVVRNVRKALADRRLCLVAVAGREAADRAARIIREGLPGASLWKGFGVVWPDQRGGLTPLEDGQRNAWSFSGAGEELEEDEEQIERDPAIALTGTSEGDLALTRRLAKDLLASGHAVVTAGDFITRFPHGEATPIDARRVGMALRSLGVECRRIRRDGGRVREYDLRSLADPSTDPRTSNIRMDAERRDGNYRPA
jgi:hypothetical protein